MRKIEGRARICVVTSTLWNQAYCLPQRVSFLLFYNAVLICEPNQITEIYVIC